MSGGQFNDSSQCNNLSQYNDLILCNDSSQCNDISTGITYDEQAARVVI